MPTGGIAFIMIGAVIAGAIMTKKSAECILIGSVAGCLVMFGPNFLSEWCALLQDTVKENVWILLVCGLFGSLIALLQASHGNFGFSRVISKFCRNERRTLLTTFVMGILIFVDDYLNVLSIGTSMKGVFDRRRLPRESLAYFLDATGAPVCVLLPFSTWAVFYADLFFKQKSVADLGFSKGMDAYIHAIPFCFYPIVTLLIVFLFALGVMPKLGGMKRAYERVANGGEVYSELSRKYNHEEYRGYEEQGNIWDFLIPMLVLVAAAIVTGDLLLAVVAGMIAALVLYVPRKVVSGNDVFQLIIQGFGDMLPTLIILTLAFLLQGVLDKMELTQFVVGALKPFLTGGIFPAVTFVLMAALAFATASFWGMSAVIAPIVFPLGAAVGADPILIMAAIISGGAFGSHACFYCDATLLSSSSAGIDNMEHAMSQLPYVVIAGCISIIGYILCGFFL